MKKGYWVVSPALGNTSLGEDYRTSRLEANATLDW